MLDDERPGASFDRRESRGALRFETALLLQAAGSAEHVELEEHEQDEPDEGEPGDSGQFESPCFALLKESTPFDLPSPPDLVCGSRLRRY